MISPFGSNRYVADRCSTAVRNPPRPHPHPHPPLLLGTQVLWLVGSPRSGAPSLSGWDCLAASARIFRIVPSGRWLGSQRSEYPGTGLYVRTCKYVPPIVPRLEPGIAPSCCCCNPSPKDCGRHTQRPHQAELPFSTSKLRSFNSKLSAVTREASSTRGNPRATEVADSPSTPIHSTIAFNSVSSNRLTSDACFAHNERQLSAPPRPPDAILCLPVLPLPAAAAAAAALLLA